MVRGRARRAELNGIRALANLIDTLGSDEALALGRLHSDLPDEVKVALKKDVDERASPDTIARSAEYLIFAPGEPAFLLLDHDRKGLPREVKNKLKEAGSFWNAVAATCPDLAEAARVSRASTSAGLFHTRTKQPLSSSPNRHVYVAVKDGGDIERALKTLHDRLWLAGFGYYIVGTAGQLLDRSLIDTAVYGPERLVFEGKPVLVSPVGQDQEKRRPKVYNGNIIDTVKAIPTLTEREAARVADLKVKARAGLAADATAARKTWAKKFAADRGMSDEEAERIATAACTQVLRPKFELEFDDPALGLCTVAAVFADPDKYVGETLSDPLEGVIYGRGKAKLYRQPDGELVINSFAHGGIKYRLLGGRCTDFRER
jgi:hypothetical protein